MSSSVLSALSNWGPSVSRRSSRPSAQSGCTCATAHASLAATAWCAAYWTCFPVVVVAPGTQRTGSQYWYAPLLVDDGGVQTSVTPAMGVPPDLRSGAEAPLSRKS